MPRVKLGFMLSLLRWPSFHTCLTRSAKLTSGRGKEASIAQSKSISALHRPQEEFFDRGMKGNLTASASLCVSGEGEYCQLDKGSSLVRYNSRRGDSVMVGLASEATRECSYGAPYVFSSISSHMEWILGVKGVIKDISGSSKRREACEAREITSKVAGGTGARPGRFPYAVSVRRTPFRNSHECQGVLISPSHVLTAASCFSDESFSLPNATTVYVGGIHTTPELDLDAEEIQAAQIIVHPKHRANRNLVDLAIVVLEKKSKKTPVRLPVRSKTSLPTLQSSWA